MASTSTGQGSTNAVNNQSAKDNKQYTERFVKTVQFPISERLNVEQVYDRRSGKPRHEVLREHFIKASC
ncbi:hypothetical protein WR25_21933, partial [Diploscapter pachys]